MVRPQGFTEDTGVLPAKILRRIVGIVLGLPQTPASSEDPGAAPAAGQSRWVAPEPMLMHFGVGSVISSDTVTPRQSPRRCVCFTSRDAAHNVRIGHDAAQRAPCSADTISAASARLLASIWHTDMIESALAASHIGLLGLSSLLTGRASHKLALLDGRRRHRRRLLGRNNEVLLAALVGAAHRVLARGVRLFVRADVHRSRKDRAPALASPSAAQDQGPSRRPCRRRTRSSPHTRGETRNLWGRASSLQGLPCSLPAVD